MAKVNSTSKAAVAPGLRGDSEQSFAVESIVCDKPRGAVVVTPAVNSCRFKRHRFAGACYGQLSRDKQGRFNPKAKTHFLVEHCADPECFAQRLTA